MENSSLDNLRHSCAHLLAAAVIDLWPNTKRTIGPAIKDGFYYDFDFGDIKITEDDLSKIQKRMKELLKSWNGFERSEMSIDEAREMFNDNEYKLELINEFSAEDQTLTSYKSGEFIDLCRGGHCDEPKKVLKNFKLLSIAGAYWRGDEKNKMLTRIYGTCFAEKDELKAYLLMLEEAKKRDHRKIGAQLGLFTFSSLVGSGLPLFTPKGTVIREKLEGFVSHLMKPYGYQRVWIPHMAKTDLYKTSGHWDKFADDIFHIESKKTDEKFVLKPMNCPHHAQIYASEQRSYRDLPVRFSEATTVYRDENTGQLQGLTRVRSLTQDDGHIFCMPDQIKQEVMNIYEIISQFYGAFEMSLRIRLSTHDTEDMDKYLGSEQLWTDSVDTMQGMLEEIGREYEVGVGEAAFYGPKIDFIAQDAIGREWQVATIQLDFNQPERFELEYTDSDGQKKRPVMIHRAISGSIERFTGVLIEHYVGVFPFWLAPVQIQLVTVGEDHKEFAKEVYDKLREADIRVEIDSSDEGVGKKIRSSAMNKIPWTIVIGDKEVSGGDFTVNVFGQDNDIIIKSGELVDMSKDMSKYPKK